MLDALLMKYQAEMQTALINIGVYQKTPVGIGEHPDIVEAVESQVRRYSEAREMYETIIEIKKETMDVSD